LNYHSPNTTDETAALHTLPEPTYYLIKLNTHEQESLFGSFDSGCLHLTEAGHIAADEWLRCIGNYSTLSVDQWLLLPDRLEGLISIQEPNPSLYTEAGSKPRLLSSFVASYKAAVAKRINLFRNQPGSAIWQRSYQIRFIPDEAVLDRVRRLLQSQTGQQSVIRPM
jgi:hypothetical protein